MRFDPSSDLDKDKYMQLMFETLEYYNHAKLTKEQTELLIALILQRQSKDFSDSEINNLIDWAKKKSIINPGTNLLNIKKN